MADFVDKINVKNHDECTNKVSYEITILVAIFQIKNWNVKFNANGFPEKKNFNKFPDKIFFELPTCTEYVERKRFLKNFFFAQIC